jgi:integrase
VLVSSTGARISEILALETKHFVNDGRTIQVRQQVDRDVPRVVPYLKTDASFREIDLCADVAEYLQTFIDGRGGLLFQTRNGTPYLHNNLESRWLTVRLKAMGVDEPGMGWHAFRRFRKTWLRGRRCQEDINNFWMGHKPQRCPNFIRAWTRSLNSALMKRRSSELDSTCRLVAPHAPKFHHFSNLTKPRSDVKIMELPRMRP